MKTREPVALSDFDQDQHLTYPHSNGFAEGGDALILARREAGGVSLIRHDLQTDEQRVVFTLPPAESGAVPGPLFFDVAREGTLLTYIRGNAVWLLDLNKPKAVELLYRAREGENLGDLPNVDKLGTQVLALAGSGNPNGFLKIDIASGSDERIVTEPWWVGHAHFSPFDESWIGFCHEGATETVPDRVWGISPASGDPARCLFDQHWDDPATTLFIGHERWSFHDRSVMAVAYGVSPGRPRGIYEVYPDGRESRLVSEGDRDWHVDVSRDGRWVVVDTTGPHDAPGKGWENAAMVSDIVLIDRETGNRQFLARSRHVKHPSHPHPVFSPDGRWIFYNEVDEALQKNRVMKVANPWAR